MATLNVLILTDKLSVIKWTIKEWFKDDFRLIRAQFFTIALIKSVTFFWDTRYLSNVVGDIVIVIDTREVEASFCIL